MKMQNKIIVGISLAVIAASLVWLGASIAKKTGNEAGAALSGKSIVFSEAAGKEAPDFVLDDINGSKVKLSDLRGKNVVLFFNEGLMCYPACLDQVAELGKDSRFNNESVSAFSVVVDSPAGWKQAQKELPYLASAKVLFDNDGDVSKLYGVLKLPSVMHYGRYPGHTYFIIDKNGIIRYTLDDPNMGLRNEQLFSELQKLN